MPERKQNVLFLMMSSLTASALVRVNNLVYMPLGALFEIKVPTVFKIFHKIKTHQILMFAEKKRCLDIMGD